MKKNILLICLIVLTVSSCYKDKGSYNYHFDEMNNIKAVTFTPEAYNAIEGLTIELQQPISEPETRRIEAIVDQSIFQNIEQLDFTWIRSQVIDDKTVTDTTYTKGFYEIDLEPGKDIEYQIMLQIKDKSTTLSHYTKLLVKTRPIFKNSLFVLHGSNNNTKLGNVEIFGNKAHVTEDVYAKINPTDQSPFTSCVGLAYNAFVAYDFTLRKVLYEHTLCVFNSNGTANIYDPFGIKKKYSNSYVLPFASTPFVYAKSAGVGTATSNTDYKCILSRDGKFYLAKTYLCYYVPGEYYEDGDLHQSDYSVKAATFTQDHVVLWDSKYQRFLYVSLNDNYSNDATYARYNSLSKPVLNANVDFSSLPASLNPQNKDAVYAYIQYIENFEESHPFFIFKDKSSEQFYIYDLTPSKSTGGKETKAGTKGGDGKDDGTTDPSEPAYTISGKVMEGFAPGNNLNSITYNSRFSTNYLFYAKGNSVYRYDTSNGEVINIYSAPDEYTISVIKFRSEDSGNFVGDLPYYLSIGMNSGNNGAITEIRLTSSADYDNSYEPMLSTGFGNIIDIQFAHIYTYAPVN